MTCNFDAMEELSGATDVANSWARDLGVPEIESPANLKALIYKLWDETGLKLHRCLDKVQEIAVKLEKSEAENTRLKNELRIMKNELRIIKTRFTSVSEAEPKIEWHAGINKLGGAQ